MDRDALLARVKERFLSADQLSYVRSLQEVFGPDDAFLGDNVFETTFDRDSSTPPLVYEVSGPYDAASREYATVGRVYRGGALQWSGDIKPGILARTAAMVCLALDAVGHSPRRLLLVGPGKLGRETLSWMTERAPDLEMIGVRGRSPAPQALLAELVGRGVKAREDRSDGFAGYDCVVMTTNTDRLLLDAAGLETVERGAVVISTCTTSMVGEVAPALYGAEGVCTVLDDDLSRRFTPDMRKAEEAGALERALLLPDLLTGRAKLPDDPRAVLIRLTGTPMQNLAVIDLMRAGQGRADG